MRILKTLFLLPAVLVLALLAGCGPRRDALPARVASLEAFQRTVVGSINLIDARRAAEIATLATRVAALDARCRALAVIVAEAAAPTPTSMPAEAN